MKQWTTPTILVPQTNHRRYLIPGRKIGVSTWTDYIRTLLGMIFWVYVPACGALVLAYLRTWKALNAFQRWWAHRVRRFLNIKLDITGEGHINQRESYIIIPLHEGFADILMLWHLPLGMRFAARHELFTWRLLGIYLRATRHIKVSPEYGARSYRQLLRDARAVVETGDSLVIFAQGGILGIETDFMLGAFALARALKRPILPIAITGTHRVWEYPYTPLLRYSQRVSMRILPPIPSEEIASRTPEDIRRTVKNLLKATALSGDMVAPRRFIPARDGYWDGYVYHIDPTFADLAADIARHRERKA